MTDEQTPKTNGVRYWLSFAMAHFWKIVVIVVIVSYLFGWLPLPEPKEILDFIREMKD